jgi:hypothetical protein
MFIFILCILSSYWFTFDARRCLAPYNGASRRTMTAYIVVATVVTLLIPVLDAQSYVVPEEIKRQIKASQGQWMPPRFQFHSSDHVFSHISACLFPAALHCNADFFLSYHISVIFTMIGANSQSSRV